MPTRSQVRGMLLEEVVLFFLESTGYRTVMQAGNDVTLRRSAAGMVVLGRGAEHQIDAIADYVFTPPFGHPQRLLVEAKFHDLGRSVGLRVVRNTIGVLKDVSEHWVRPNRRNPA